MRGFYWLIEGVLAGCPRPGSGDRPRGATRQTNGLSALDADLTWLRGRGIAAVLTLTETPLPADSLDRHSLVSLHVPVADLTAPSADQLELALSFIDWQHISGRATAVHCRVGQGRTGCVLAAYLIRSGSPPEQAVQRLRSVCPGAIAAPEQESALYAYALHRDWLI